MTLTDFMNKVVDLNDLNYTGSVHSAEELKNHWQENYKIYVTFRSQTYDKAYSLLKYIRGTFKRFDILPSFSYFEGYESKYLDEDELLSGLWILILVYRSISDLDIKKIKQCKVVDRIEIVEDKTGPRKMNVIKVKYFSDRFDTEVETEEQDEEY